MIQAASASSLECLNPAIIAIVHTHPNHRNPEPHLRPKEEVFNMKWKAEDQETLGARLAQEYHLRRETDLTSCSTCHR